MSYFPLGFSGGLGRYGGVSRSEGPLVLLIQIKQQQQQVLLFCDRGAGPGLAKTALVAPEAGSTMTPKGWRVYLSVSTLSRHVSTRKMVNYAWPG